MAVEYAVVDCDAPVLQYTYPCPTLAEAAGGVNRGNYVVAIENGVIRPLNTEEAELKRYVKW